RWQTWGARRALAASHSRAVEAAQRGTRSAAGRAQPPGPSVRTECDAASQERRLRRLRARRVGTRAESLGSWLGVFDREWPDQRFERDRERSEAMLIPRPWGRAEPQGPLLSRASIKEAGGSGPPLPKNDPGREMASYLSPFGAERTPRGWRRCIDRARMTQSGHRRD